MTTGKNNISKNGIDIYHVMGLLVNIFFFNLILRDPLNILCSGVCKFSNNISDNYIWIILLSIMGLLILIQMKILIKNIFTK